MICAYIMLYLFAVTPMVVMCGCDSVLIMGELSHSREYLSFRSSVPLQKVTSCVFIEN